MLTVELFKFYFGWTYSGINFSQEATGGLDCVNYLSSNQRFYETSLFVFFALAQTLGVLPFLRLPLNSTPLRKDWFFGRLLLTVHAITFGVELGFKFATGSLLWILNPCHIVTMMQLFLLSAPSSPLVTAVFRLHLHMLNGPLIALFFPVLNTRLLPFEAVVYYVQHGMIILIPFFLIYRSRKDPLWQVEPYNDFSWDLLSLGTQTLHHFVTLQYIGLITSVNLDNMLCPALSDPFRGQFYRQAAYVHQTVAILFVGKGFTIIYSYMIHLFYSCRNDSDWLPPTCTTLDSSSNKLLFQRPQEMLIWRHPNALFPGYSWDYSALLSENNVHQKTN